MVASEVKGRPAWDFFFGPPLVVLDAVVKVFFSPSSAVLPEPKGLGRRQLESSY